jgi:glycosyltransferase involved in cell wall biosynthesis
MKRGVVRGVVDGYSSYSLHLFRVIEGLTKLGRDIHSWPVRSEAGKAPIPRVVMESVVHKQQLDDWEMIIHCPSYCPAGKKKLVYNTMWESTRLHKEAVLNLNQADVIVVPSDFNLCMFNAQGIKRTMTKVPMGIDTDIFHYKPQKQGSEFVFGVAGRTAAGGCRKGFEDVLTAWKKAFPKKVKDVRLQIKCFPDDPEIKVDDDRIQFIRQFWTRKDLANWYAGLDCFASASKGEGWGLMQHEAMATGRPVIAVPFGGITEFYDESVGYPVDFDLKPAENHYQNGGLWAVPKPDSLVDRMREVYGHRGLEKALRASERGMKLNWDNSNKALDQVLRKIGFYT